MRCVAVINQKGGCGKTTVAINLAACLAEQSRHTLLVDMDSQSHCSVGLAIPEDQVEHNIYDVLISAHSDSQIPLKNIIWQISQNFDLAPSGIDLAALEPQLAGKDSREDCLRDVLAREAMEYDYVVIDCPPSVGLLTFNALRAADEVIIPVETGYFALHGLGRQLETLQVLQKQCQQKITFRVLASMYDVRTKLAREVLCEIRKYYSERMCKTIVNFNTKLKEAASFGQPITEYNPSSKGMKDFMMLAREIINIGQPEKAGDSALLTRDAEAVETKLKMITKSANELLAESQQLIGARKNFAAKTDADSDKRVAAVSVQEKIDNFYGVRQNQGVVKFVALYPKAKDVCLAGDFNNWRPESTPMHFADNKGRWAVELPLAQGQYRYRYVVDGRWQQDPYNDQAERNEFGEYNSILTVK
jgi:chromosome partitioning protein